MSLLTSNSYRWLGQNETKYDKLHWPSDARKRKQNLAKIHQFMNSNNAGGFMSNKYTTTRCYNNGTKSLKKMLKLFNIGHRSDHYLPLSLSKSGLHKLWYPSIRDTSTWSKFGAHGEHGDVFLFSNLGALWFSENRAPVLGEPCSGSRRTVLK